MQIFITGIAGFLGSHLAERMLHLGHEAMDMKDSPTWVPKYQGPYVTTALLKGTANRLLLTKKAVTLC
ncbi:NAD-dependent epimerase/dehydratase family protein [Candidatus Cardinium hertigii]|uniref:NAD-dependent epimerase/dehydratase domain-containing protein n=1 Tax=Candidatus Cardinium hertigii TaxID=247481 RepID=A0A2Z3LI68_9BACT|nr:NAD-dependent epimerase/dehydratase family protein [Candidatus Cardinium hertigii]AWN82225.1 hypothetical protein DK880_00927 [Candidatus Cardinium hertigii]